MFARRSYLVLGREPTQNRVKETSDSHIPPNFFSGEFFYSTPFPLLLLPYSPPLSFPLDSMVNRADDPPRGFPQLLQTDPDATSTDGRVIADFAMSPSRTRHRAELIDPECYLQISRCRFPVTYVPLAPVTHESRPDRKRGRGCLAKYETGLIMRLGRTWPLLMARVASLPVWNTGPLRYASWPAPQSRTGNTPFTTHQK